MRRVATYCEIATANFIVTGGVIAIWAFFLAAGFYYLNLFGIAVMSISIMGYVAWITIIEWIIPMAINKIKGGKKKFMSFKQYVNFSSGPNPEPLKNILRWSGPTMAVIIFGCYFIAGSGHLFVLNGEVKDSGFAIPFVSDIRMIMTEKEYEIDVSGKSRDGLALEGKICLVIKISESAVREDHESFLGSTGRIRRSAIDSFPEYSESLGVADISKAGFSGALIGKLREEFGADNGGAISVSITDWEVKASIN